MSGSLLFSSSLEGARRRLAVTPLGAKRLTSAGISAAGQVGCDAAMEVGPCISISSLDFAVGVGPALFCSRGEDLGFEAAPSKGYSTDVRKDRKSTRLNSSHTVISYAVFCLKKKKTIKHNK